MISLNQFKKLRIENYFPQEEIYELDNWKLEQETWVGESIGFSEWLRPENNPTETFYISLDLDALPEVEVKKLLEEIGLNVDKGINEEEVISKFGKPINCFDKVKDRKTLTFTIENYEVSMTILNKSGLSYISVKIIK